MGKTARKWEKREREWKAQQDAYIAKLEATLLPGQKLLTCRTCHKIVKVPEHLEEVHHIVAPYSRTNHLHEIRW